MLDNLTPGRLHFLLADDDHDDRFFFEKALKKLFPEPRFSSALDGEKLMTFLRSHYNDLPDVLFLDLNMPRKNGSECLKEIKSDKKLDDMAVIIYSTSGSEDVADILYRDGAHYYVRKSSFEALEKTLKHIIGLIVQEKFLRPDRNNFVLKLVG